MPLTVEHFGKSLVASGLMAAAELQALWGSIPTGERPRDGEGFSAWLVKQGKLTQFQAGEILSGSKRPLVMGDYVLVAKIGEGGMGQVYKAQHKRMNRFVALKVMSAAAMKDESAVKRFQREVHAAARLEHPNIVTAYDSGEVNSIKYLVMQFVDGGDLSSLVKQQGTLPIETAVNYVLQAARGLAFAHGEGVIHRDIKPANLLVDKKGVVKILDMGLARFESGEEGLTGTEQVMGTVDYMSPEQAAQTKSVDARADIYSLGCTLWFLLSGKRTYDADTMIARLMAHRDAPLPSLMQTRDDAPWPLEQAFHKMIAKRPEDRFQSMDEVIAALEPFAGGGGSSTSGSSSTQRGSTDRELSAFLQGMGTRTAGKTVAKPAPASSTDAGTEVTAQFVQSAADTDPKSEVSIPPLKARGAQPQARGSGSKRPPSKPLLLAGGGGALLLLLLGVWLIIRDKDGNEVARVKVPDGGSATVQTDAPKSAIPPQASPPVAGKTPAKASPPISFSMPSAVAPPTVPPPPGDYALLFDGNSTVDFAKAVNHSTTSCTIEAFARPDSNNRRGIVCSLSETCLLMLDPVEGKNWVVDHALEAGGHYAATSVKPAEIGRRVHLAGVLDSTEFRLYVDGKLVGMTKGERRALSAGRTFGVIGRYFKGLIDEVRVSKTVRYKNDFNPPNRHEADADTLALYHCDEGAGNELKDASGNERHGALSGVQWVRADGSPIPRPVAIPDAPNSPLPGDYALRFEGLPSHVDIPNLGFTLSNPLTFEAWVQLQKLPEPGSGGCVFSGSAMHLQATPNDGGFWQFYGHQMSGTPPTIDSDLPVAVGRWVHLAVVSDGEVRSMFVDGVLQKATRVNRPSRDVSSELKLGGRVGPQGLSSPFTGLICEVRFSGIARYKENFQPPQTFTSDGNTLGLYQFNEGTGTRLTDSSGHNRHGTIHGATWVRADGSPIPPRAANLPFTTTPTRWPLPPSKPEDIQWLMGIASEVTLRMAATSNNASIDLAIKSATEIPTAPATIIGIEFNTSKTVATDEHLARIAGLSDLESFRLVAGKTVNSHDVTNPGFGCFSALKHLRRLKLIDRPQIGEVPNFMGSLTKLEFLALPYHTANEWAQAAVEAPALKEIQAYRTTLNDSGLGLLEKYTNLEAIDLRDSRVTKEAIDRFAVAVPQCRITWGTSGSPQVIEPRTPPPNAAAPAVAPPLAVFPFDAATAAKHQAAWAAHLGVPVELTNGLGMKFRLIPPGEFQMGLGPEFTDEELIRLTGTTNDRDINRLRVARPAHAVRITRPFYMQVDEVTSGQYREVVGELRPKMEQDPNKALWNWVAWPDAIAFCNKLSDREGKGPAYRIDGEQITPIANADGYRLPTEAEWEFACRAGTNTLWYFGAEGSPDGRTFRSQAAAPNPFFLNALYGGSNEWCWDATDLQPYTAETPGPRIDPRENVGLHRIKRGGSNQDGAGANRFGVNSFYRVKAPAGPYGSEDMNYSGFGRVVLPIPMANGTTSTTSHPSPPKP